MDLEYNARISVGILLGSLAYPSDCQCYLDTKVRNACTLAATCSGNCSNAILVYRVIIFTASFLFYYVKVYLFQNFDRCLHATKVAYTRCDK